MVEIFSGGSYITFHDGEAGRNDCLVMVVSNDASDCGIWTAGRADGAISVTGTDCKRLPLDP